jgi:hypothetical protein
VKAATPLREGRFTSPLVRLTKIDSNWRENHTEPRITARTALRGKKKKGDAAGDHARMLQRLLEVLSTTTSVLDAPRLAENLVARFCKSSTAVTDRNAAIAHGKLRHKQGYTPGMLALGIANSSSNHFRCSTAQFEHSG